MTFYLAHPLLPMLLCVQVLPRTFPECMSRVAQHQRAGLVASAAHGDVLCLSAVSFLDSVLVAYEVVKPRDDRKTSQDLQYRMQSLKNRDVGKKLQSEQ